MTISLRPVYAIALAVGLYAAVQQPTWTRGIVVAPLVSLAVITLAGVVAGVVGVKWRR